MISKKLSKEAKKSDVLIELSARDELPEVIEEFLKICKNESIFTKRSQVPSYQISFYYVSSKKDVNYEQLEMKEIPTELEHAMTMIYMNRDNETKITLPEKPGVRTLLLREDLETKYSLEYECESSDSKKSAITFLCDMTAAFLNRACNKEIDFFDQKVDEVIKVRKNESNVLKDTWLNMVYQIPGLGKEKCLKIVEKFPTFQSILHDYEGKQLLKDLDLEKSKLGATLTKRIYKVFIGTKHQESVIE